MTDSAQAPDENGSGMDSWSREVRKAWDGLPQDKREALLRTLNVLPSDAGRLRGLIEEAAEHVRQALGDRSAIAIVGPANVGKSTLYNQLIMTGQERAAVSAVPGTTRQAQAASAGVFNIVDTPGVDAAGELGRQERASALAAANAADVLLVMFDAGHGVREPEQQLMARLLQLRKPTVVALNKMDLIPKNDRPAVIRQAAGALGLETHELIALSAEKGEGLERVLLALARAEPGIVAALGAALPAYRWSLAQSIIARAASTAAAIAVTPIPILDFVPLLAVQASMVLSLARVYNYKLTLARARELLVTFGAGLLGRTLFYELSKFGGPPGWLVAAGVAVGTTTALGYGSTVWFDRGSKLSGDELRQIARAVSGNVMERLRDMGRRRPDRQTLKERIDNSLQDLRDQQGGLVEKDQE